MSRPEPRRGEPDPLGDILDEKSLADEISKAIEGNDCPAAKDLEAFVRRGLKEAQRIEVKSHLSFCGRCQKKVHALLGESLGLPKSAPAKLPKSFQVRLGGLQVGGRRFSNRTLAGVGLGVLLLAWLGFIWIRSDGDFPYTLRVAQASSEAPLRVGQALPVQVSTPRAIHLIEVTIDGDGRVQSRISPGPRKGKFSKGDSIIITPSAGGDFDLYVIPCPPDDTPESLLSNLQQFLKTNTALSRENQRSDIETALGFYHARFLHQVFRVQS